MNNFRLTKQKLNSYSHYGFVARNCFLARMLSVISISSVVTFGILFVIFFSGIFPNITFGAFNPEINYQAKLTATTSIAVADGGYNVRFKLYTSPTGGTPIWTESQCFSPDFGITCNGTGADNRAHLVGGLFSTLIGSVNSLSGVDFNQTLYLGVEIGGSGTTPSWDGEMSPRKVLGTVPAAFVAKTLNGLNDSQFIRSDTQNATSTASTFLNILQTGIGKIAEFFGAAGQSVLAILSNGNVGVGTSTPAFKLDVNGTARFSDNVQLDSGKNLSFFDHNGTFPTATGGFTWDLNNDNAKIYAQQPGSDRIDLVFKLADNVDANDRFLYWIDSYTNETDDAYPLLMDGTRVVFNYPTVYGTGASKNIDFYLMGNGSTALSQSYFFGDASTKNIGIGTTAPGSKLSISGGGIAVGTSYSGVSVADGNVIASGAIGIGTSSPTQKLDVYGNVILSGSARSLQIGESSGGTLYFNNVNNSINYGANQFQFNTNQTHGFTFNGGNLGIGTTSPFTKLSVAGDAYIGGNLTATGTLALSGAFIDASNSAGTNGNVLQTDGNSTHWVSTTTLGFASATQIGAGIQGQVPFYNSTGSSLTATSSLFVAVNGNVGIGTTSPGAALDILSNSGTPLRITHGNDAAVFLNRTTSVYNGFGLQNSGVEKWFIGQKGLSESLVFRNAGANDILTLEDGGVANSIYVKSSGNVGIGTTNPTQTLDMKVGGTYGYNGVIMAQASTTLQNWFIGQAGNINSGTTGSQNYGFGYSAVGSISTGSNNIGLGSYSLSSVSSGSYNMAIGSNSLVYNTIGSRNIGIGMQAMYFNVSGSSNVGIGFFSLYNSKSSGNVGIGYSAGLTLNSGSDNTFIGNNADVISAASTTVTNSTAIGNGAQVTSSNQVPSFAFESEHCMICR